MRIRRFALEERILVVDDEEAICATIARHLRNEGCSCVTAKSGKNLFITSTETNFQ